VSRRRLIADKAATDLENLRMAAEIVGPGSHQTNAEGLFKVTTFGGRTTEERLPRSLAVGEGMTVRLSRESMRGMLPRDTSVRGLKDPLIILSAGRWGWSLKELAFNIVVSRWFLEFEVREGPGIRQHLRPSRMRPNLPEVLLLFCFISAYPRMILFRSKLPALRKVAG